MRKLSSQYTIIIVTHNMQQAARVSEYDRFSSGWVNLSNTTAPKDFTNPANKMTEDYITGRFG